MRRWVRTALGRDEVNQPDDGVALPNAGYGAPTRLAKAVSVVAPAIVGMCVIAFAILVYADRGVFEFEWIRGLAAELFAILVAPMGALLLRRVPSNPLGWVFSGLAVGYGALEVFAFIAIHGAYVNHDTYLWTLVAAWITVPVSIACVGTMVVLVPLLFPDGQLESPRSRRYARIATVFLVLATLASGIGTLAVVGVNPIDNTGSPLSESATVLGGATTGVSFLGLLIMSFISASNLVGRYRRATGVRRRQLGGFAFAEVLVIVFGFVPHFLANVFALSDLVTALTNAIFIGSFSLLMVAMAVAILRHGLYDIDVFISRTLVYGTLAVFITAVYVAIAVGIGALVGSGGKPNLALSILATAIVAIGFEPVRERVQKIANRLVYGKRATPYEVLSEFSGRVAETYAADVVLPRMAQVLQEGTGAESATVWLRGMAELRPAATFPDGIAATRSVPMSNGTLPALAEVTRAVEVRHQGELLGALTVTKRRGESLTPIEQKLVDDLAHQAGLVLKNVGLSADLQARLDELRASRQRLVHAQDLERRRLERNLHDGAQQHLVALKVKLGLAEMLLSRDPEKAAAILEQLKGDTDEALETLRDLARGIYPPLLADKGLVVALESQARKATVPVAIEASGIERYAQDVEATVYFCVLEALQNVQKYAHASHVIVHLRVEGRELTFEVSDDGEGFDTDVATRGTGLTNMADRVDALGGALDVTSRPNGGTTITGTLPVELTSVAV
jgi:signal transduction histidine kinase